MFFWNQYPLSTVSLFSMGLSPLFTGPREMNWQFPLFIHQQDNTDTFCKFHPRSDFGVVHPEYLCPLVISETISDENESDRWRMLIEAIAAARAGHFLMKSDAEEHFFVVAIYLRRSLEAERYIVMQTSADEGNPVRITLPLNVMRS